MSRVYQARHAKRQAKQRSFTVSDPVARRYLPPEAEEKKKKEKARDWKGASAHLVRLVRPHRFRLALVALLSLLSMLIGLAMPALMALATNVIFKGVLGTMLGHGMTKQQAIAHLNATGQESFAKLVMKAHAIPGEGIDFHRLALLVAGMIAAMIISALCGFIEALVLRKIVATIGFDLRRHVQDKISRMPLKYLDSKARGDVLSRMTNDVDNVGNVISQTTSQIITATIQLIGLLIIVFKLSWRLTLAVFAVLPVGLIIAGVLIARAKPHFTAQWQLTGVTSALVEDTFTGHDVLTSSAQTDHYSRAFDDANEALFQASYRAQFITGMVRPVMSFFSWLMFLVIATLGAVQVLAGRMTLGGVQAYIQYAQQLSSPIQSLASLASQIQSGLASAERVFEFLDADEEAPDAPDATDIDHIGALDLVDVTFGYEDDKPVLEDLTLHIAAGETVAICGPTGSGKTTLVNVLMGFYPIQKGQILIDGVDVKAIRRDSMRSHTGMVLQDTWLFGGTIAENIAMGNANATRADVEAAARATGLDRLVATLPDGLDTAVHDDGAISAGEKQLVTIARAFIADPDLLVLDEATSNVDTRTERDVQEAMSRLRSGRTSIVIAHRLSTIRDADRIVVIEDGRIVEEGRHAELLAAEGAYARLYRAQFFAGEDIGTTAPAHSDSSGGQFDLSF
ncbi:MAG: ABC transporter ATP-binding protein [Actinomycetaceae bacterium]|nr:ABC transporter ATP-binding protein [Actinomycetaceae bacterium]MDU0970503.1 ABC transporter ATP-binding protein [Actinomycetaceae bacterium]